jgi:hypothetical protein
MSHAISPGRAWTAYRPDARDLAEAGFEQFDVAGKLAWREAERDLWESTVYRMTRLAASALMPSASVPSRSMP